MSLVVLKPGIFTLLQDGGRRGLMHTGLTQGGPLDIHAWAWANRLLGNPWGMSALEVHVGGLELMAEAELWLALTGAVLDARVDGRPLAPWQSFVLRPGQRLRLGYARLGLRAYLAVAGGFQVPGPTVPREGLGGLHGDGRPLQAGDVLPCRVGLGGARRGVPTRFRPDYTAPLVLRLIPGGQFEAFSKASLNRLLTQTWRLSPRTDRMGARLEGEPLDAPQGLISEGIALGAVQVPPEGLPLILLQDRQTLGGYPKLGAIHPLDLAALAQRQPGTPLRLRTMQLAEAQAQMRTFLRFFHRPAQRGCHIPVAG